MKIMQNQTERIDDLQNADCKSMQESFNHNVIIRGSFVDFLYASTFCAYAADVTWALRSTVARYTYSNAIEKTRKDVFSLHTGLKTS